LGFSKAAFTTKINGSAKINAFQVFIGNLFPAHRAEIYAITLPSNVGENCLVLLLGLALINCARG